MSFCISVNESYKVCIACGSANIQKGHFANSDSGMFIRCDNCGRFNRSYYNKNEDKEIPILGRGRTLY